MKIYAYRTRLPLLKPTSRLGWWFNATGYSAHGLCRHYLLSSLPKVLIHYLTPYRLTCRPYHYPRDAMLARVFAIATCLSVCPSVRPSYAGIVHSRAKAGSWNVHHLIAPWLLVSGKLWLVEKFARGHPKKRCQMRGVWVFSTIFNQYVAISRKRCILETKLL